MFAAAAAVATLLFILSKFFSMNFFVNFGVSLYYVLLIELLLSKVVLDSLLRSVAGPILLLLNREDIEFNLSLS